MALTTKELMQEVREDVRRQYETQTHILKVLERQQGTLDEHIRRTEAAEKGIADLRAEIVPLKTSAAVWGALAKALTATGALVGVATAAVKLIQHFG